MKKIILLSFVTLVCCGYLHAYENQDIMNMKNLMDNHNIAYKNKVESNLQKKYNALDIFYETFFNSVETSDATAICQSNPPPPKKEHPECYMPSFNKTAVYYDCAKFLFEFSETWQYGDTNTNNIGINMQKCVDIMQTNYTHPRGSLEGYTRFPHGLAYLYHNTGEKKYKDALQALAERSNWAVNNRDHEYIGYSRDVAYSVGIYIAAVKAGINTEENMAKLDFRINQILSHLEQWHTGRFKTIGKFTINKNGTQYPMDTLKQPYMVGITMNTLIEYYERIEKDPRIPTLIKASIDDLWEQHWYNITDDTYATYGYTIGRGTFWAHANYECNEAWTIEAAGTQQEVIYCANNRGSLVNDTTYRMPEYSPFFSDLDMMIGPAYAWYAKWLRENKPESTDLAIEYMNKAIKMYENYIATSSFNDGPAEIIWEGGRYMAQFLHDYKKFMHTFDSNLFPCSSSDVDQCFTQNSCEDGNVGGHWTGERCQYAHVQVKVQTDQTEQSSSFYWSVDTLPQSTPITSDSGNIPITRSSRDATSVPGFQGNCMHQTDNHQYYHIPMTTVPRDKGTIRMYVQHDTTPESMDPNYRFFFSTNGDGATTSSLSAYVYKNYIYFYLYDSAGGMHRAYGEGKWKSGIWYLYEFSWDASTGSIVIKRDGAILAQLTATSWANAIPSWSAGQNLTLGYGYPIGSLDEIHITD
jgi:hypothetical protein